jgi:hypothetical protein
MILGVVLLGVAVILLAAWHDITGAEALAILGPIGGALLAFAGINVNNLVTGASSPTNSVVATKAPVTGSAA